MDLWVSCPCLCMCMHACECVTHAGVFIGHTRMNGMENMTDSLATRLVTGQKGPMSFTYSSSALRSYTTCDDRERRDKRKRVGWGCCSDREPTRKKMHYANTRNAK